MTIRNPKVEYGKCLRREKYGYGYIPSIASPGPCFLPACTSFTGLSRIDSKSGLSAGLWTNRRWWRDWIGWASGEDCGLRDRHAMLGPSCIGILENSLRIGREVFMVDCWRVASPGQGRGRIRAEGGDARKISHHKAVTIALPFSCTSILWLKFWFQAAKHPRWQHRAEMNFCISLMVFWSVIWIYWTDINKLGYSSLIICLL